MTCKREWEWKWENDKKLHGKGGERMNVSIDGRNYNMILKEITMNKFNKWFSASVHDDNVAK